MTNDNITDERYYNYCNNIDAQMMPNNDLSELNRGIIIASEYGWRAIATTIDKVPFIKKFNKDNNTNIIPICMLDNPYGVSTTSIRKIMVLEAIEAGASEIEMPIQYHLFDKNLTSKIGLDIETIAETCDNSKVKFRPIINPSKIDLKKNISRIASILNQNNITDILVPYYGNNIQDYIIDIRDIRKKTKKTIKVMMFKATAKDYSTVHKSDVKSIAIDLPTAMNISMDYQKLLSN